MPDFVPEAVREGRDLLDFFYGFSREDDPERYLQQEEFRQDAYRIIVIQIHLAIEELVRSFVFAKLTAEPDRGNFTHQQDVEYVFGLTNRHVLELAARLHVLSKRGYEELVRLNAIRNKCSHHWALHSFKVAEKLKNESQEVEPNISFNSKNLLTPDVMKEDFLPLYSDVYLELFSVHYGLDHDRVYTDESLEAAREL